MIESPLAPYLTRFTLESAPEPFDPDVEPEIEIGTESGGEPLDVASFEVEPSGEIAFEANLSIETSEAEQRLLDLRAELEAEGEARIAALEAAHAEALEQAAAAARASWSETEGARLSAQIAEGFDAIRQEIDARVADALTPLVAQTVVDRARAALREALTRLLSDPDQPVLTLQAPADLIEMIRRDHGEAAGLAYVVRHEVDALVSGAGVHIETRVSEALAALYADIG